MCHVTLPMTSDSFLATFVEIVFMCRREIKGALTFEEVFGKCRTMLSFTLSTGCLTNFCFLENRWKFFVVGNLRVIRVTAVSILSGERNHFLLVEGFYIYSFILPTSKALPGYVLINTFLYGNFEEDKLENASLASCSSLIRHTVIHLQVSSVSYRLVRLIYQALFCKITPLLLVLLRPVFDFL